MVKSAPRTFPKIDVDEPICSASVREGLGWPFTHHWIAFLPHGPTTRRASHLYGLHAGLSPRSQLRYKVRYPVRLAEALGLVDQETCHYNAAARAQEASRAFTSRKSNHVHNRQFIVGAGILVFHVNVRSEFCFEGLDTLLQQDHIVAVDLAALGRVQIFADGARPLAGETSGQGRIASCFPLSEVIQSVGDIHSYARLLGWGLSYETATAARR